jgi:hypothetical protein
MPITACVGHRALVRKTALAVVAVATSCAIWAPAAGAGPVATRIVSSPGTIVPIPASVPHEEGDMVDRRIVPDLVWIAQRFPIYVTDGYSGPLPGGEHVGCHGCHVKGSDHYNGLAVDVVPLNGSGKCDTAWRGITRLAKWAEPQQNRPAPPFRWVGYDGDAGHGCGHHLHLSWEHAVAREFQLAEWVEVFPVKPRGAAANGRRRKKPKATQKPPAGPSGGISTFQSGGVSAGGD